MGADDLLILVRDPDSGALLPAPGFPRTLPGGPTWRAFLSACAHPGEFAIDVDYPDRLSRKGARAYVSANGSIIALIGGNPHISARGVSELLLPIVRLLQSERQVTAAQGAAAAATLAAKQTSTLAASLDEARRRLSKQATQLQNALNEAARLNRELTELTQDLEQRVETALAERRLLAEIVENTDALVMVVDLEYRWLAVNRAAANEFERVFGRRPEVGTSMFDLIACRPEEAAIKGLWSRALRGEAFTTIEALGNPGSDQRQYEMKFSVLRDKNGGCIGAYQFVYDVTDRLEAEKRLAEAQEALRQAQKMEATGQLAGGIAHDFNNLLTVIIGGLGRLERGIASIPDQNLAARLRRSCEMAQQASQRSAKLTARLLAFSRRQPLDPKPIDANRLIADLADMLARTLGEQARLEVITAPGLWMAQADVNELENAILNLAVNARDAMSEGGRLTIETGNTFLDEDYVSAIAEPVAAGQYVMIAVTDTGVGMDVGTLTHVFEPFFTTKPVGQGTGLGLSQVYGFIRQSNGHVRIYSELGQGTTVKLYLPRSATSAQPDRYVPDSVASLGGDETVLVVEDHDDLRSYSVGVLQELGYRVLEAPNGPAALDILGRFDRVDLLFTDVVLPEGMDGRRLADQALRLRPDLKVLFTTGYSRNAIMHNGRLDPGVQLLPKPFTFDALAAKVRFVLDQPTAVP
ncbi:hybrid sensor histidine kinase/response regulator [Pseudaminobacter sp. NGMCC 1.201702]|uniref:hybrid sensor histidine kinase/response regulator n=1 Tax=Pseudaminobacter sp. NGMCC 1.201702 TaxID=3391825 RepID=UPI0039EF8727